MIVFFKWLIFRVICTLTESANRIGSVPVVSLLTETDRSHVALQIANLVSLDQIVAYKWISNALECPPRQKNLTRSWFLQMIVKLADSLLFNVSSQTH